MAGQIYIETQAPGYITGHSVSLGYIVMSCIKYWIVIAQLKRLNSKDRPRGLLKVRKGADVGEGDLGGLTYKYSMFSHPGIFCGLARE